MSSTFLRLLPLLLLAVPVRAEVPGATFALNRLGNHVEGNAFPRKDGVYISGGPRGSCTAPGLSTGIWCFQVTDPAGTVLLTTDPIAQRSVRVAGGVIVEYLGTTRASSLVGPCGALNVRLAPFAVTPYPIGEYKIWLTRIEDYDPQGSNLFGFDPALAKSDNFRVNTQGPQTILRGHKFYDYDQDGVWNEALEPLEVAIGGWRVELRRDGVLDGVTYTDQDGWYQFIRDRDASTFEISEISPNGFVNDATVDVGTRVIHPLSSGARCAPEPGWMDHSGSNIHGPHRRSLIACEEITGDAPRKRRYSFLRGRRNDFFTASQSARRIAWPIARVPTAVGSLRSFFRS